MQVLFPILASEKTKSTNIEKKSLNQSTKRMSKFQNPGKVSTSSNCLEY